MKRQLSLFLLILFMITSAHARYSETDALKKFKEANTAYQKLNYDKSVGLYKDLIENNYRSKEVYFNLANAYFKAGNFSKAILNYERAKKIEPDDEDTNFNLKIASLKVVDKIETAPQIFYKRWANRMATTFSSNAWSTIFIIMFWLLFGAASLYVSGGNVITKKIAFFSMMLFLVVSIGVAIIAIKSHVIATVDKQAIIMTSSVYIKSSPDEKGNDLFILHEGTKADVLDEIGEWKKIRIANGNIGWMKSGEMEMI